MKWRPSQELAEGQLDKGSILGIEWRGFKHRGSLVAI